MDFDSYKVSTPYPQKPSKPQMPFLKRGVDPTKPPTPKEYTEWYETEYIPYEDMLMLWKDLVDRIKAEEKTLFEKFKADLFTDLGITKHPKKEKLFSKAWDLGHSSGYSEVYSYACDLVDLIE